MHIKFFNDDQWKVAKAALEAAGHEVVDTAITVPQHAVAAAEATPLGTLVKSEIATLKDSTLSGAEKFEQVVTKAIPEVLALATTGGFAGVLTDAESFAREFVQTLFDAEASTTAGKVAEAVLKAVGAVKS